VLETLTGSSLLEVRLQTGKRNQIRIQSARRGYPLVGERQYVKPGEPSTIAFSRQALHAHRLAFRHPVDGRPLSFDAPLPRDLTALIDSLRDARRV
jgi:23S rRNA pseudouridine1911/1915/1917 synthase